MPMQLMKSEVPEHKTQYWYKGIILDLLMHGTWIGLALAIVSSHNLQ